MIATLATMLAAYTPFWQPMPLWDIWYVLLIPLCLGISIVYKAVKCREMNQVPKEAATIFVMIVLGMALAGAVLMGLMRFMEK